MPWLPYEIGHGRLVSSCRFINSDEVFAAGMPPGRKRDTHFPVPQLELTLPDFCVDCFSWDTFVLVSARMRAVMALSPSEVEYFPIDASRSASAPRNMNYMIMNICVKDRVSYEGSATDFDSEQKFLASLIPGSNAIDVKAKPKNRIFHDEQFVGSIFCTDEFAVTVLGEHCSGIRFFDPRFNDPSAPMRFRTLRGVEEEGDWDPVEQVEHTTVVEEDDAF